MKVAQIPLVPGKLIKKAIDTIPFNQKNLSSSLWHLQMVKKVEKDFKVDPLIAQAIMVRSLFAIAFINTNMSKLVRKNYIVKGAKDLIFKKEIFSVFGSAPASIQGFDNDALWLGLAEVTKPKKKIILAK